MKDLRCSVQVIGNEWCKSDVESEKLCQST